MMAGRIANPPDPTNAPKSKALSVIAVGRAVGTEETKSQRRIKRQLVFGLGPGYIVGGQRRQAYAALGRLT
jgi:hypothetical protein